MTKLRSLRLKLAQHQAHVEMLVTARKHEVAVQEQTADAVVQTGYATSPSVLFSITYSSSSSLGIQLFICAWNCYSYGAAHLAMTGDRQQPIDNRLAF